MYLNLIEVAESFGVSEKWLKNGFSTTDSLYFRSGTPLIRPSSCGILGRLTDSQRTGFLAPEEGVLTDELALALC